jgi:hypothetical protein
MMFFRKKYALGLLVFAGLIFFVSGVYLAFFWMKGGRGDYTVAGGATLELSWYLETNDRTEGRFTVSGGNEEIRFYIKNPYGVVIYDAGIVKKRLDTGFTAANSGVYSFYFENEENSEKIVQLRFRSPYEPRLTIFDIMGLSMMFGGLAISAYCLRELWIITHTHQSLHRDFTCALLKMRRKKFCVLHFDANAKSRLKVWTSRDIATVIC